MLEISTFTLQNITFSEQSSDFLKALIDAKAYNKGFKEQNLGTIFKKNYPSVDCLKISQTHFQCHTYARQTSLLAFSCNRKLEMWTSPWILRLAILPLIVFAQDKKPIGEWFLT